MIASLTLAVDDENELFIWRKMVDLPLFAPASDDASSSHHCKLKWSILTRE